MQHQSIRLANRCNRLGGVWTLRSTYERAHKGVSVQIAIQKMCPWDYINVPDVVVQ